MALFRYLFLTFVTSVYGQTSSCPTNTTTTIESQTDAEALSVCSTIGPLIVSPSLSGTLDLSAGGPYTIDGNFTISNATGLISFISSVTSISGSLILANLPNLIFAEFRNLVSIGDRPASGGLIVAQSYLDSGEAVDQLHFPALSVVQGDVILQGNFSNFDLHLLQNVTGNLAINTTDSSFNCSAFYHDKNKLIVHGNLTCSNLPTPSSSSSNRPKNNGLPEVVSTNLFAISVTVAICLLSFCLGIVALVRIKRRFAARQIDELENNANDEKEVANPREAELSSGAHYENAEMEVLERRGEFLTLERRGELAPNWGPGCDIHELGGGNGLPIEKE